MSQSELTDLQAIIIQILPDPKAYAQRVLNQFVERTLQLTPTGPELKEESAYPDDAKESTAAQTLLIAAALGACDCWGRRPDCPACSGEGQILFFTPEASLYEQFILPVAKRMAAMEEPDGQNGQWEQPVGGNAK